MTTPDAKNATVILADDAGPVGSQLAPPLTPKERRRYVREHGHEHKELKYIQTLCGLREKRQTALGLFPRDIFKMILRQVVDGEIAQNGNLLLNMQKPKQPWFPECVVQ